MLSFEEEFARLNKIREERSKTFKIEFEKSVKEISKRKIAFDKKYNAINTEIEKNIEAMKNKKPYSLMSSLTAGEWLR